MGYSKLWLFCLEAGFHVTNFGVIDVGPEEPVKIFLQNITTALNKESCKTKIFIEEIYYCLSSTGEGKNEKHKSGVVSYNQVREIDSDAQLAQGED